MKYIWEILLQADKQNIPRKSICFELAKAYSPYMEISFEDLNTCYLEEHQHVEVNPYYRFYKVFKDLFHLDLEAHQALRHTLLDILLHYLATVDLKQGWCKEEFYTKFIREEILQGISGQEIKNTFISLLKSEKDIMIKGILKIYTVGSTLVIFKQVMKSIFPKSIIYQNEKGRKEVLIYIEKKKSIQTEAKIKMICEFFLPLNTGFYVYWEYHFGVIGLEETMKIEENALY